MRYQFVEAPVEQSEPFSNDSPFQSVIDIPFATPPPPVSLFQERNPSVDLHPEWAELELAKRFGFVMDVEADYLFPAGSIRHSYSAPKYRWTQLVHRNGLAFLQIKRDGKGFRWVQNRLHLACSSGRLIVSSSTASGNIGATVGGMVGGVGGAGIGHSSALSGLDDLRAQLENLCGSSEELGRLWDDMVALRTRLTGTVEVATVSEPAENAVSSIDAAVL
jgi:hypothetical protein